MLRSNSDRTSTPIKYDLLSGESQADAMRFATYLAIVFAVLNFVNALPFPQFDNGELASTLLSDYIEVILQS